MWKQFWLLAVLMFNLIIAGCATEAPQELQFETIEQVNAPGSIKQRESPDPGLLVIANSGDIEEARRFVTDEAVLVLEQLDFSTQLACSVFSYAVTEVRSKVMLERKVNSTCLPSKAPPGEGLIASSPHLRQPVRRQSGV